MGSLFYSLKYGDFDKEFENFDLDQYKLVYWIKKKCIKSIVQGTGVRKSLLVIKSDTYFRGGFLIYCMT